MGADELGALCTLQAPHSGFLQAQTPITKMFRALSLNQGSFHPLTQ